MNRYFSAAIIATLAALSLSLACATASPVKQPAPERVLAQSPGSPEPVVPALAQLPPRGLDQLRPEKLYQRVWELVQEQYYDRTFNGQDWSRWKTRYDGKIRTTDDAHKAIETMLGSLGDRYTRFLDRDAFQDERDQIDAKIFGIGVQIGMDKTARIIIIAPIEDTPAFQAGVKPGDEIAEIDEKSTKGLSVQEAAKRIKGPRGTKVVLGILRQGKPFKFSIVRDEIHTKAISTATTIDPEGQIGYVRLTSFISQNAGKEMARVVSKLSDCKGLILDFRDNPGGLFSNAVEIAGMFLPAGCDIVATVDRDGYKAHSRCSKPPLCHKPLVILINKSSASASEITSGALKDHCRAVLVGDRTFGKGLVQGIHRLDDGTGVNITIARYLTPNDVDINKKGITPDYVVALTDKDYEAGRGPWWFDPKSPAQGTLAPEHLKDIQLQKALEVLRSQLKTPVVVGAETGAVAPLARQ